MHLPKKNILDSNTSKAQATAGIVGVLIFIRNIAPSLIPWGIEADAGIVVLYNTVLAPFISRKLKPWIAKRSAKRRARKEAKRERKANK